MGLVVEKIYFSLLNLFVVPSLVYVSQMQRILVKLSWNQILKWGSLEREAAWRRAGESSGAR